MTSSDTAALNCADKLKFKCSCYILKEAGYSKMLKYSEVGI